MDSLTGGYNIKVGSVVKAKIDFEEKKVTYSLDGTDIAWGKNLALLDPKLENIKFGIFNYYKKNRVEVVKVTSSLTGELKFSEKTKTDTVQSGVKCPSNHEIKRCSV